MVVLIASILRSNVPGVLRRIRPPSCANYHPNVSLCVQQPSQVESAEHKDFLEFSSSCDDKVKNKLREDMVVVENFLSETEEKSLVDELEPYLKKLRYEFDHWDDAIHGYRETERLRWNSANSEILNRVKEIAFPSLVGLLPLVHVLDLAQEGYIKPHVDSVRFCGNTIAGLSLLTPSVMRLVYEKEKDKTIDVMLKRRSLYIMKDFARYEFTHEILGNDKSLFRGLEVPKTRRISVICRNEPEKKT